ncbi:MAG: hypothetical protein LJF06_10110 [Gemmatimonadetes bacterium]|nr:hypothetical protein [Gemmatimonadota bacterium]
MSGLFASLAAALAQVPAGQPPLPAKPPIGGPIWTIVVPAALLAVSIWGTWLLYRHFSKEE